MNEQGQQAQVGKVVRIAKTERWKELYINIGRTTPIINVWGMIRKMRGVQIEWQHPVLKEGEKKAISNKMRCRNKS